MVDQIKAKFEKTKESILNISEKLYPRPNTSDVWTGNFRDGVRRIDVVLVVADNDNENVEMTKINFMLNAVKAGLQLEMEPGVVEDHSNLLFIKIHAPDNVLFNYSNFYDIRPYFKQARLQFIRQKKTFWEHVFPSLSSTTQFETEWIKMLRAQYKPEEFSNIERSRVVYQMLTFVPFGSGEEDVGIAKLLDKKIFVDLYALHDGPYFYVKNQDMWKVNGRQLLFYNWARKSNLLKFQPLSLIHEYFGDRVSMFFTFFSFYNQALLWASVVGVVVVVMQMFDKTDAIIVEETCRDKDTVICPMCRRFLKCPFKKLNEYCLTAIILNYIDNPSTFYYSLFVSIWAMLVITLWRRTESYRCWLWELVPVNTLRAHYKINYKHITRSSTTGILKVYEGRRRRTIRLLLTFLIVCVVILIVFFILSVLILFRYWLRNMFSFEDDPDSVMHEYYASAIFGVASVIILFTMDEVCRKLSYKLTDFENHRNDSTFERSLIIKLNVFTFTFSFSMLIFFSYIKGAFYTYPSDPSRWYTPLGIGMMSCSPFGCLDEVWILLSVSLIVKQIALRSWYSIRRMRTDYNEGKEINKNVPVWEREYRLKPATEAVITEKYREIVTQFASLTLFVAAFPLAPACALIANVWDVRFKAKEFLLGTRRVLLPQSGGLGAWREVLLVIAYGTALTNGLTIAFTTRTLQRNLYLKTHPDLEGFLLSTLSVFDVKDYLNVSGPGSPSEQYKKYLQHMNVHLCYYPGNRYPPNSPRKYELTGKHWQLRHYELMFIIAFEHGVFLLVFLFHYVIPPVPRDIYESLVVEGRIKKVNRIKRRWLT